MTTMTLGDQEHEIGDYDDSTGTGRTICGLLIYPSDPGPNEGAATCSGCLMEGCRRTQDSSKAQKAD